MSSLVIDLTRDNPTLTESELKVELEKSFQNFPQFRNLNDNSIFDVVMSVNNFPNTEAFMVVDANHSLKKLKHWQNLVPRVKPFFGRVIYFLLYYISYFMSPFYSGEMQSRSSSHSCPRTCQ